MVSAKQQTVCATSVLCDASKADFARFIAMGGESLCISLKAFPYLAFQFFEVGK
jgi:hypothetical protein